MKRLLLSVLLPSCAVLVLFAGCDKKKEINTVTYRVMIPVFESKAVVYENVKSQPARQLETRGKILIKGEYLFISEPDKGVHVYDNSNPKAPQAVSFINIPGNEDIAVRGNYLYADLYSDLVTLDIRDPENAKVVGTVPNFIPSKYYENQWNYYPDKFVVGFTEKDTTIVVDNSFYPTLFFESCTSCFAATSSNIGQPKVNYSPAVAGSMARFVVVDNFLYTVTLTSLISTSLQDPIKPVVQSETHIFWGIETVYPFNNRLFIGSAEGVFIYNIDNPSVPVQEGSFVHARACDPVVTDGEHAFVTLRSGDQCAGNSDQLDVLDVKNISQPQLVKTYPLFNPHGLGKDGNLLFVCDGSDGIKIFDATDVSDLKLIHHIPDVDAYDVIPWRGRLIASTKEGLMQYDYSDVNNIKLISMIRIKRNLPLANISRGKSSLKN